MHNLFVLIPWYGLKILNTWNVFIFPMAIMYMDAFGKEKVK